MSVTRLLLPTAVPTVMQVFQRLLLGFSPREVAELDRVLIVGEGGAGKSTILKQMLAYTAQSGRIPLWVSLAKLPVERIATPAAFIQYLVDQAKEELGLPDIDHAYFETLIEDGLLTIGFDALDEAGSLSRQQRLRALIVRISDQWTRCQVFVTARPYALMATPLPELGSDTQAGTETRLFLRFVPDPFKEGDVRSFLKTSFGDEDGKLAETILVLLGAGPLTQTPLSLSLVAIVARRMGGRPLSRAKLFELCVETLCGTWEEDRAAPNDGFSVGERVAILKSVAWKMQGAGQDTLPAIEFAAIIGAMVGPAAQASAGLSALAQRNSLISATWEDGPGSRLITVGYVHPQFREYLAGAYLADRFLAGRGPAVQATGEPVCDDRWRDALRFAASTLNEQSQASRDQFLGFLLSTPSAFDDLIHGNVLAVADVLAEFATGDDTLVGQVVGELERVAVEEPALRSVAIEALLGLGRFPAGRIALTRLARGDGAARRIDASNATREVLVWRLKAIVKLAEVEGPEGVLGLVPAPQDEDEAFEIADVRARLGDLNDARRLWRALFDKAEARLVERVANAMLRASDGATLDDWLAKIPAETITLEQLLLGLGRNVIAKDGPAWIYRFTKADAQLARLAPDEYFAPSEVSDLAYAAMESGAGAASEAGRQFLKHALRHPALVWYVGPRIGKSLPELAANALERLADYIITTERATRRPDWSRLNTAYSVICQEPDDELAVPLLLELLERGRPRTEHERVNLRQVTDSLHSRGHGYDAMEVIRQHITVAPCDANDADSGDGSLDFYKQLLSRLGPTGLGQEVAVVEVEQAAEISDQELDSGIRAEEEEDGDGELGRWLHMIVRLTEGDGSLLPRDPTETLKPINALARFYRSEPSDAQQRANAFVDFLSSEVAEGKFAPELLGLVVTSLSDAGFAGNGWRDGVARAARTCAAAERGELVTWLRGHS